MLRCLLIAFFCVGTIVSEAFGIVVSYHDEFDDPAAIKSVEEVAEVKKSHDELQTLANHLLKLDRVSLAAVLDKPGEKPRKKYAMPLGEVRVIALSGLREVNDERPDEDFVSFHPVGDFAAVEFYYARQKTAAETPFAMKVYLKADKTFPKLTKENLDERLAWERSQLKKLVEHIRKRPPGCHREHLELSSRISPIISASRIRTELALEIDGETQPFPGTTNFSHRPKNGGRSVQL